MVSGSDPATVHRSFRHALEHDHARILHVQGTARGHRKTGAERWSAGPSSALPKDRPAAIVDGVSVEGTFRAHQVPLSGVGENPEHLRPLNAWLRSYRPETLIDDDGNLVSGLAASAPAGSLSMGASPWAHGGSDTAPLPLPPLERYALDVGAPGSTKHETTRPLGKLLRDIYADTDKEPRFRLFSPDETNSNRLGAVFEVTDRCLMKPALVGDDNLSLGGRVMEVLSEHLSQGWLEGYVLTGRYGLIAPCDAFARVSASMTIQHAEWLQHASKLPSRNPVPSLNILLTSTCWRNDHNGFSHQGPGLIDTVLSLSGSVIRVYRPLDANTVLAAAEHILTSKNYVNLIVVDKQDHPQYLNPEDARRHAVAGASIWHWAGNESSSPGAGPNIVMACAGDVPTKETLAAAWRIQRHVPGLRVRVVNLMDALVLTPQAIHPHGLPDDVFEELVTAASHVIVAWHGYARAVHQLLQRRTNPGRFQVRGYSEQSTTTTPFDMVVLSVRSRYHLDLEALHRVGPEFDKAPELAEHCRQMLTLHERDIREYLHDMPEMEDWVWSPPQARGGSP